ncbi:hypothetical protein [Rhodoblastus sp.]|uniref:hypothetical protein n=1 Tax=Rhodoblastus sp. TaxID=1962975 RepID=UPI003F9BF379
MRINPQFTAQYQYTFHKFVFDEILPSLTTQERWEKLKLLDHMKEENCKKIRDDGLEGEWHALDSLSAMLRSHDPLFAPDSDEQ